VSTAEPTPLHPALQGGNRLKLGTFGTNLAPGITFTRIPGTLRADWAQVRAIARTTDAMGLEAIVPIARWKGYGGPTDPHGSSFDTLAWAAAVGAVTEHARIFSTCHAPAIHPIVAAKQLATIDHVTGGRAAVNVVAGWYRPELEMFGRALDEHDRRYDLAEEWTEILLRLWTEEDEFDHEGEFFRIERGYSSPKPVQRPRPPIMNAAVSGRGMEYAARASDLVFVKLDDVPERAVEQVAGVKRLAREQGREIQVWTFAYVVCADTEQEAKDFVRHYAVTHGEHEASRTALGVMGVEARMRSDAQAEAFRLSWVAGNGGHPLVGTAEQIAARLDAMAEIGIDGCLLGWPRWEDGLERFAAEVLPRLEARGLRAPFGG
jgi:alkanesulfonate monooxygenase SsuD/methylene tetrahydromethanopterin reductase-like flavin-dependent oxidoreductase (luciferase family)